MNPGAGNVTTGGCVKVGQEELAKLMTSNALKLLDAGVTTARDLGCPGVLAVNLRNDIARGDKLGPRFVQHTSTLAEVTGTLLTPPLVCIDSSSRMVRSLSL